MKRVLRIIAGVVLVLAGILAAITPLTPGSWLVPIGLEILGIRLLVQRRLLGILPRWLSRRFARDEAPSTTGKGADRRQ